MLIPLGLGLRLPRFPWITVLICALLVYYHFANEAELVVAQTQTQDLAQQSNYTEQNQNLFLNYCVEEGYQIADCHKTSQALLYQFSLGETEIPERVVPGYEEQVTVGEEMELDYSVFVQHMKLLKNFISLERNHPQYFADSPFYLPYEKARAQMFDGFERIAKKSDLLTSKNVTPLSLYKAQVRHGGWFHLLSNLFFLLVFGVYVEARLKAVSYLLLYLGTGSVGLLLYASNFLEPLNQVVGASANVSGLMGAFYILFFHSRMRFYFWYIFVARSVSLPISWGFPLLYMLGEVVSGAESLEASSPIAYFAHIIGMGAGMALAHLFVSIRPVNEPFLYSEEFKEFEKLNEVEDFPSRVSISQNLLSFNPNNYVVRNRLLQDSLSEMVSPVAEDDKIPRTVVAKYLSTHIRHLLRMKKGKSILGLIMKLKIDSRWDQLIGGLSDNQLVRVGDYALKKGHWAEALKVYDLYLYRKPNSNRAQKMGETIDGVLETVYADPLVNWDTFNGLRKNIISEMLKEKIRGEEDGAGQAA